MRGAREDLKEQTKGPGPRKAARGTVENGNSPLDRQKVARRGVWTVGVGGRMRAFFSLCKSRAT